MADELKTAKEKIDELEKEAGKVQALAQGSIEHIYKLEEATNGHTLENIATIMQAAPPAEDVGTSSLYGVQVIYRRRPKVEWIEDITDEMVIAAGGRVPCEVAWKRDFSDAVTATLAAVHKDRFVIADGGMQDDGSQRPWAHRYCRVKASDLKEQP